MIVTISDTTRHSKYKSKRIAMVMMLVILCTACGTERPAFCLSNVGEVCKEQSENLVENNTETANIVEESMEDGANTSWLEKEDKENSTSNESLRKEKYNKESGDIWKCLVVNVPEILNEWNDYVVDMTDGDARITIKVRGDDYNALTIDKYDVYRDDEESEYLGKYYLVYVGEQWEDHTVYWANFYVSENFDEVLWCDFADIDGHYSALYLDEWRNSRQYRRLGK